ncbi:ABC transporter substrate-binding protein [Paenibacillus agricola]|uniref:Extracellular solute-binding protein n=1 Tax=Paenibacillus agricola TaxID=2716264 RepID=A0ABX0J7N1_9BACL|nr:extracellular solute-binding protein [Paenibacillus agricola]NHN31336.1 extracellular solute-binding protein [Paenibacillus agricola]
MNAIKKWSTAGTALLLAASMAACSSTASPATEPAKATAGETKTEAKTDKPVELIFWSLGTNGYEKLAEEYKTIKPNVTIKIQNTADQTAHHNNMLTALSANKGAPDIFMLEIAFLEKFMEAKDKFNNLNDLGAGTIKTNYVDWKWQQGSSADGKFQLGLPTDIGPTVVYYRTDLLEQAGIASKPDEFYKEIATWDKFAETAAKFKQKTGKTFVDMPGLLFNGLRDQGNEIFYNKNEEFIGDTNPQIKKAYDFTVKGIKEGWVGKNVLWTPEWSKETNDGGFAVMLAPAWMNGTIKGNAKDASGKWMITQMPEGAGNWGGSFLSIPKESKNTKEAYEFIAWMDSKEGQLKSYISNGLMPSIPAVYDDARFKDLKDPYFNNQATSVEFAKAAKSVKPIRYGKLHDATDSIMKEALMNVQQKGTDPQAEWDGAIKKIKELNKRS